MSQQARGGGGRDLPPNDGLDSSSGRADLDDRARDRVSGDGDGRDGLTERARSGRGDRRSRGASDRDSGSATEGSATGAESPKERVREMRDRQRQEFGGFNLGAAFFGWLVAIGLGALLTALLSAAGTAVGLTTTNTSEAASNADTIGVASGIALLVVLFLAYYAGGYVAGRMSRFNGAKQGFGVWAIALAITLLLGALGAILGAEYNVLSQLNLPRIPIDEGDLATGGVIALIAFLVVTLLAAVLGGIQGVRYHKKVDRVGLGA